MAKDEPKRRSIIGTLVDNKLTEREDDSTINITYVGRRSIDGLCSLAAKAGSKFSASELLTAYKDIEKQAKEEVYSGATVEFGFANNSLGVEGAVIGPGAGFDPAVNRVVMRCIPLVGLRPELDMIDVIINGTNEGMPTVTTLYDVFTKTTNAKLTPGNTLNGKGNRVKIAGSEGKEVGFYRRNKGRSRTRDSHLAQRAVKLCLHHPRTAQRQLLSGDSDTIRRAEHKNIERSTP